MDTDPEPAAVIDEDGNLAVVTYGSSSCPPTAISIEAPDASTVVIELDASMEGACTADIAPTTHIIPMPDSATERPLTIELTYLNQPWTHTVTIG